MPRAYGKSVSNGKILHFSATSLTKGDPDSEEGCPRAWYYERIEGRKPPQTRAQEAGTRLHAQIEGYATTGRNDLGSLALRGMQYIPTPGDDLLVEHDLVRSIELELRARDAERGGQRDQAEQLRRLASLASAPLRVRGVPLTGFIDLLHARAINYGVGDGEFEDAHDPPGTVEVIDWKTTSAAGYIKPPEVMARTIQMTIYGRWVTTCMPAVEQIRLSHVYFVTKGSERPRKVSLRVLPEQIDRQWQRIDRVAGLLLDVAQEQEADKVEANTRACGAFGGCPHRAYCRAGRPTAHAALAEVFGEDGAAHLLKRSREVTVTAPAPVNIAARKSLLGAKKPADDPAALKAAAQKLAREEIEAKYPGVPAAWEDLLSLGVGHPKLDGEFARVVAELRGEDQPKGGELAGAGELVDEGPFEDPRELPDLVAALRTNLAERADTAPAPAAPTPAPISSTPAPAAPAPTPPPAASSSTTLAPAASLFSAPALLPPDAPASDPALATQAPTEDQDADAAEDATAALPVVEGPVKRAVGRPKGAKNKPKLPEPGAVAAAGGDSSATPPAERVFLYIDCTPSCRHESLADMVHAATAELNRRAGAAGDFRLVLNDHELAYGRWKGLIANMVRAVELRPGHYVLQGAAGDVAQAVVDALRDTVIASGGVVVQ